MSVHEFYEAVARLLLFGGLLMALWPACCCASWLENEPDATA